MVSRLVQLSTGSVNSLVELASHLDPSLVVLQLVGSSCQPNRCFAIKEGIAVGTGVGTAAVRTSKVVNCSSTVAITFASAVASSSFIDVLTMTAELVVSMES